MLEVKNISKTFNLGTVNEKQALRDLSLRKRSRKIYPAECHCRNLDGGRGEDPD